MSGRQFSLWGASVVEVLPPEVEGGRPGRSPTVCSGPFGHRTARLEALVHQANHAEALADVLRDIAAREECCCCEYLSWYGEGHTAGCPQGDAQAAVEAYDEGCA